MSQDSLEVRIMKELSALREQNGRLETRVKLVNYYQKQSNDKVDKVIGDLNKRVQKIENKEIYRQGFASASGFFAGIIGACISKLWG